MAAFVGIVVTDASAGNNKWLMMRLIKVIFIFGSSQPDPNPNFKQELSCAI